MSNRRRLGRAKQASRAGRLVLGAGKYVAALTRTGPLKPAPKRIAAVRNGRRSEIMHHHASQLPTSVPLCTGKAIFVTDFL